MSTCARWAASLFRARLPDSAHLKDQQKAVATLKEIVSWPGCSRIPGSMIDSFEPHFNLKEQNDMNDMYMISVLMYVLKYCKTLILCSCRMLIVPCSVLILCSCTAPWKSSSDIPPSSSAIKYTVISVPFEIAAAQLCRGVVNVLRIGCAFPVSYRSLLDFRDQPGLT
jgi:hypothetical protein